MKAAPALAASSAWAAEKTSVTFTRCPRPVRLRVAFRPSGVIGHLTTTFRCRRASRSPSSTMPDASVLTTSALMGPSTIEQISRSTLSKSRPVFATSEGLVVTPSRIPQLCASRSSATSAVSMKRFMTALYQRWDGASGPREQRHPLLVLQGCEETGDALTELGMDQLGCELGEREEDEAALVQLGMRDLEGPLLHDVLVAEEDVEVDHPGAPAFALDALSSHRRLDRPFSGRTQRQPNVSFPRLAESVPRRHHDPGLGEAAHGETRRRLAARHRHPDVERPRRRIADEAQIGEPAHEHLAPLAVHGPQA